MIDTEHVSETKRVKGLVPATRTADALSDAIDVQDASSVSVEFDFGASGDTLAADLKVEGQIQHCATSDGTFADVDAADLKGTLPVVDAAADDDQPYRVAYMGEKGFLKVGFNFTGTHTNGIPCSVNVLKGHLRSNPPA